MIESTISALFIAVGIIHLLPLSGVASGERLSKLYGISFQEPNLVILMRHRAVLFGLLGAFFLHAAAQPAIQLPAFVAGFLSVGSFIVLAKAAGGYNTALARVIAADLVAAACLILGLSLWVLKRAPG